MQSGKGRDCVCFLGNQEEDERNEKDKKGHKERRQEGLNHFFFPCMSVQVGFLIRLSYESNSSYKVELTRLGQNKLIFWIDTRPTRRETGNNQNNVKPLDRASLRARASTVLEAILPNTKVYHPIFNELDKLMNVVVRR